MMQEILEILDLTEKDPLGFLQFFVLSHQSTFCCQLLLPHLRWFCNPSHFDGGTETYAAKFDREKDHFMVYPMAWDLANKNIPGVNRSTFYNTICGAC